MNQVELQGKVVEVSSLVYTVAGIPRLRWVLAVKQTSVENPQYGYVPLEIQGKLAEDYKTLVRVGDSLMVKGELMGRRVKANSESYIEVKVLVQEARRLK